MTLFRIYIDEVGNHDLAHADNPNERFLSLTGVIVTRDTMKEIITPALNKLKADFFQSDPDEPVILHRKDIVKKQGPFRILQDQGKKDAFDNALLVSLRNWDYAVTTVVIDKLAHRDQYVTWQYHPYHYCLKVLLERFLLHLEQYQGRGDVMIESRGGNEDRKLKKSYSRLFEEGTEYVAKDRLQTRLTSRELKVKPKAANVSGLQIADLIAYPSRREILQEKGFLTMEKQTFSDEICRILGENKYLRNARTGEIWGYGKKMLP